MLPAASTFQRPGCWIFPPVQRPPV